MRVCPSIRRLVGQSIGLSVGNRFSVWIINYTLPTLIGTNDTAPTTITTSTSSTSSSATSNWTPGCSYCNIIVLTTFFIYHIFPSTNEQPADRRRRSVSQRTKPCPIMKTNLRITSKKPRTNLDETSRQEWWQFLTRDSGVWPQTCRCSLLSVWMCDCVCVWP